MKISHIFKLAIDFGTFNSRDNFFSFTLKCLFYIIPAVIIGNYTDVTIKELNERQILGDNTLYYIILQTLVIITTFYIILILLTDFTSEFQLTISGGYFIVLYFGMQTNYMNMIKEYVN